MADDRARSYVRVVAETVFEVVDPSAAQAAAQRSILARSYEGGPAGRAEQVADLEDAANDVSRALLELAEPIGMFGDENGVIDLTSTISAELCDRQGRLVQEEPPYADLFEVCACGKPECERCRSFQLTPRNAALLHTAASCLADAAYDDVEEHGDDPVDKRGWMIFHDYPPLTFRENAVWRRQAARAFDDLAADLEGGDEPRPRCIGEEMALHLMLDWVRSVCDDEPEVRDEIVTGLLGHSDDYDWDLVFEHLFQDDDLSALFRPADDGIEDPDGETNRFLGMGDYRPPAWFDWFLNMPPRDGRRPFRR